MSPWVGSKILFWIEHRCNLFRMALYTCNPTISRKSRRIAGLSRALVNNLRVADYNMGTGPRYGFGSLSDADNKLATPRSISGDALKYGVRRGIWNHSWSHLAESIDSIHNLERHAVDQTPRSSPSSSNTRNVFVGQFTTQKADVEKRDDTSPCSPWGDIVTIRDALTSWMTIPMRIPKRQGACRNWRILVPAKAVETRSTEVHGLTHYGNTGPKFQKEKSAKVEKFGLSGDRLNTMAICTKWNEFVGAMETNRICLCTVW